MSPVSRIERHITHFADVHRIVSDGVVQRLKPLNLDQSYKYRPLDDYLIDRARWQCDKEQLIERAGLEAVVDPRKMLKELNEALYLQYLLSNRNIAEGRNPYLKFKKTGCFTLATPKQEESDAKPLPTILP